MSKIVIQWIVDSLWLSAVYLTIIHLNVLILRVSILIISCTFFLLFLILQKKTTRWSILVENKGLEPLTPCVQGRCSKPTELIPRFFLFNLKMYQFDNLKINCLTFSNCLIFKFYLLLFQIILQKVVEHRVEVHRRISTPDSMITIHIRHHLKLNSCLNHRFSKFERILIMHIIVSCTMNEQ